MSLRHVVVVVDPRSKESPTKIFDRFRSTLNMTIVEWGDQDITDNLNWRKVTPMEGDTPEKLTAKHRHRQGMFYHKCIDYLQNQNRTWTSFIDVDEFMTINGNRNVVSNWKELFQRPGSILSLVQKFSRNNTQGDDTHLPPFWYSHFQQSHCVTLARGLKVAIESTDEEVARDVPSFIEDPRRFDTLRFRYRASVPTSRDGPGKSIIDVSKVNQTIDYRMGYNAHKVLRATCPDIWVGFNQLPIGIYHYLGSWEAYSYRDDARSGLKLHSYEKWATLGKTSRGGADDFVRPWIRGFADLVGEADAKYLLQDAGLPSNYTETRNFTAQRTQRYLFKKLLQ